MKEIRLKKLFVSKEAYDFFLRIYKEVKQTRDIHKILVFKSFIARVMEAQGEYYPSGKKIWDTLENYITEVLMRETKPLQFIIYMTEHEYAYGYRIKKDLRKIA